MVLKDWKSEIMDKKNNTRNIILLALCVVVTITIVCIFIFGNKKSDNKKSVDSKKETYADTKKDEEIKSDNSEVTDTSLTDSLESTLVPAQEPSSEVVTDVQSESLTDSEINSESVTNETGIQSANTGNEQPVSDRQGISVYNDDVKIVFFDESGLYVYDQDINTLTGFFDFSNIKYGAGTYIQSDYDGSHIYIIDDNGSKFIYDTMTDSFVTSDFNPEDINKWVGSPSYIYTSSMFQYDFNVGNE